MAIRPSPFWSPHTVRSARFRVAVLESSLYLIIYNETRRRGFGMGFSVPRAFGGSLRALAGFSLALLDGTAQAQVVAANGAVETVVVTARLRPEDAQTVPVSLSVVDSAALG